MTTARVNFIPSQKQTCTMQEKTVSQDKLVMGVWTCDQPASTRVDGWCTPTNPLRLKTTINVYRPVKTIHFVSSTFTETIQKQVRFACCLTVQIGDMIRGLLRGCVDLDRHAVTYGKKVGGRIVVVGLWDALVKVVKLARYVNNGVRTKHVRTKHVRTKHLRKFYFFPLTLNPVGTSIRGLSDQRIFYHAYNKNKQPPIMSATREATDPFCKDCYAMDEPTDQCREECPPPTTLLDKHVGFPPKRSSDDPFCVECYAMDEPTDECTAECPPPQNN